MRLQESRMGVKKVLMIVLIGIVGLSLGSAAFADTKKDSKQDATGAKKEAQNSQKAKDMTVKGTFVSADATAQTIVIKADEKEMTFDVSKVAKMPELAAGAKVHVVYTVIDGKNVALKVKAITDDKKGKAQKEKSK